MLAPYARAECWGIALGGIAATWGGEYALGPGWAIAPAVLTVALLSFYRDPPRRVPAGDNLLLAPADGRVMSAGPVPGEHGEDLEICIFLSVLDVHVNRAPCAARVTGIRYVPGGYLNALRAEATERNERSEIDLEPFAPISGRIQVRQIAGLLARRIVCRLKEGERVAAGQRFGMIKLGSQTQVRASNADRWRLCVRKGDPVRGGRTVLAEWIPANES